MRRIKIDRVHILPAGRACKKSSRDDIDRTGAGGVGIGKHAIEK